MKMPLQPKDNIYSKLLNNDENLQVFKLLGSRCQSISTTVAQVYLAEPPTYSQWTKKDVGVLCFIKDNTRKNFFFRLFCLRRNFMVWEHEMYNNMEYTAPTPYLHVFEGEEAIVGFNFADNDEARDFKAVVDQKILLKKKREEKKLKSQQTKDPISQKLSYGSQEANEFKKTIDPAVKEAKRKRKYTTADISHPFNYQHITHVGWNPDSGFDVESKDDKWNEIFQKAGVSRKQLNHNPEYKKFVYSFLESHSEKDVIDKSNSANNIEQTTQSSTPQPPVVPPRGAPRTSHVRSAPPPPRLQYSKQQAPTYPEPLKPSNSSSPSIDLNEPPTSTPPPPPPPTMPPPDYNTIAAAAAAAPPPPPLPMVDFTTSTAPQPPPPPPMSGVFADIIKGTSLKPVEERKLLAVDDSRNNLLEEIRKGTKLKPVNNREVKVVNNVVKREEDLAEALKRALAEKFEKAKDQSEDDDSDDDDDDEWE